MVFYYGVRWCASSGARPCVGPGTLLSTSLAGGDKDPTWAFGCILSPLFSLSPLSHPSLISLPSSFPSPLLHVSVPLFLYRFPFPFFGSSPLLAWFSWLEILVSCIRLGCSQDRPCTCCLLACRVRVQLASAPFCPSLAFVYMCVCVSMLNMI